jgi:hypothetical protein
MVAGAPSEFLLSPSPTAAADARKALTGILHGGSATFLDRATQLIHELFASVEDLHALAEDDRISVKVFPAGGSVRVEIRDHGTGAVLGGLRKLHGPSSQGWSPHLLSKIADRWGLVSSAEGAWIWFELDHPISQS